MRPRSAVCTILLLVLALAVPAGAAWISPDHAVPTPPRLAASGAADVVRVDIEVPGYDVLDVEIDGRAYASFGIPGAAPLMTRGYPELPVIARDVAIPATGAASLRIVDAVWDEVAAPTPAPSRGHFTRDVDPASVPYVFDGPYAHGGVWPANAAELTEPFIVRDVRGVTLRVHPLRWDADRGVMLVLRSATIEIATKGSGANELQPAFRRADGQFERIYRGLFLNPPAEKYTAIDEPGRMLIVCADAYQSAMSPFVAWKQQKGLDVEMITTSSVGGSASGIQTAIDTRFAEPAGLTYVILVGDIGQVPTNSGSVESADSDPVYGMVAGSDLYPDLFVSRISGNSLTDIQIQVAKFIRYESEPDTGTAGDWYHMAAGLASNEGSPTDYERADLLRADLLAYNFTHVDQIYQPTGTESDITDALNEGRSLVNYIGHGSGTSWGNPYFDISSINALANGWMQPWILDVSCSNGDFSNTTCFAEAWLRAGSVAQPTGAVASYSASTLASWVPPCVMQAEAVDLLCAESENTLGALYFFGGMQVLDDYPGATGEGAKLIEQYNIFGDCSLVVRTTNPATIAASHLPVVHLNATTFDVDVPGVAGLTACLYENGVVHGVGVTDASGHVTIALDVPVTVPVDVTLTVTGYNMVPYVATLPAINPSSVTIVPGAVDALVPTDVTVTVLGADGVTPVENCAVWAEGPGYSVAAVPTDANGEAVLSITAPYGPSLDIVGQESGEAFELFREPLTVNAAALTAPDLTVTTDFGLSDAFGVNLPGTVHASAGESGFLLHVVNTDDAISQVLDTQLEITPPTAGDVTASILLAGYDVYSETFAADDVFGTLTGRVFADGSAAEGAEVSLFAEGGAEVATAVCDATGAYDLGVDIAVAEYTLTVDFFGYLHYETPFFVNYGANTQDVTLDPAPAGQLSGTVTALVGGAPLDATVKAYRGDDGSLYAQTTTDPGDGSYLLDLPYFDYDVQVTSSGYIPATTAVTVDAPALTEDFLLEETNGNILILDDDARVASHPDKKAKDGTLLAAGYADVPSRSTTDMQTELEGFGYTVTVESFSATDPGTWNAYDLVVVACGANTGPMSSSTVRNAVIARAQGGGKLLVEGGEVGYEYQSDATMKADVLHISSWNGDSSGSVTVADAGHPVMSLPNVVTGPVAVTYSGYGDQDRVTVAGDADMVGAWSSYSANGSVVCYDPNPSPIAGQIVYFTFNYSAMDAGARAGLLQNAVVWLLNSESGDCAVSGQVVLPGESDHSGILVELVPGGGSTITDASGAYAFSGVFAADYTVRASKDGWSTETVDISLTAGETLTGVDMQLASVVTDEFCATPGLAIPDNDAAGIDAVMAVDVPAGATVSALEVQVDITHTYIGDLVVELRAPDGSSCILHNRSGGSTDDIYGWYPTELTAAEDMSALVGVVAPGDWTLHVHDEASYDTGTLNGWCLRVTYGAVSTAVGDDVARALVLHGNVPNPFNPATKISFTTPRDGRVELRVYDVAGRLVRTLVDGHLAGGDHEISWQGRDDRGRKAASGVYYYRLITADGTAVRKMTLVK